jgi:hypothetical protein
MNWNEVKPDDLKDSDFLVKAFKRYLKKECSYSTEEARFACDIIENPYGKYADVNKTLETTVKIGEITYEIYYCTAQDCSDKLFDFYMLVDIATLEKKDEEWFSYYLAKKKYIVLWH